MSEKHLTELPWKTLAVKQGVKDMGLGKALAAYGLVDATKEPAKALEALQQIAELAVKLKKANLKNEDVVAHLDEVVKEVKKTTPSVEARLKSAPAATAAVAEAAPVRAKSPPATPAKPPAETIKPAPAAKPADDEDEEKEAAAFKKDLKQKMISALAQVKARAPGDPEQEKEPKPQLQFMACLAAKSSAVIVARKVGSATKKLLLEIAGIPSGGKFVQGECLFEKNSHTFVVVEVPGGLAKKLATALQTETGQKYKVRVRNTDGSVSLDSDTDVDPEAAAVSSTTPNPAAGGDEMAKFKQRLVDLLPQIKSRPEVKAGAGTKDEKGLNIVASEAGYFAKKQDFAKANQLLDLIESLLKAGGASGAAGKLTPIWKEAKDAIDGQLEALYAKLTTSRLEVLRTIATQIEGVLENFRTDLIAALMDYEQATGPNREKARAKALQAVTNYQTKIPQDKHVIAADTNPFGVKVTIRQTLGSALSALAARLTAG